MNSYQNGNYQNYGYENYPRPVCSRQVNNQHRGRKIAIGFMLAAAFGAVAAGSFFLVSRGLDSTVSASEVAEVQVEEIPSVQDSQVISSVLPDESKQTGGYIATNVSEIVEKSMPGVVSIINKQYIDAYMAKFYGQESAGEVDAGAGSGVIIGETDDSFYIVTNDHVIEGASSLAVNLCDGKSVDGEIMGLDEQADLAIVKISKSDMEESSIEQVKVIEMADSDSILVGQSVIAIGNALGYGQSVTTGIVSAVKTDAEIQLEDGTTVTRTMIQTDASINPGNSGGALLDSEGKLIGINEMKYSSTEIEGMCFAIPVNQFKEIQDSLMNGAGLAEKIQSQKSQQNPGGNTGGNEGGFDLPDGMPDMPFGNGQGGSASDWIEFFRQFVS